jgi:MYXO-CTERM domain-containing protein
VEGDRSWYHDGGDAGYTLLTRVGGVDFESVGMLVGAGWHPTDQFTYVNYEVLLNGVITLAGSIVLPPTGVAYLGFSGGSFDAVRLSATSNSPASPTSETFQALQLDSVEITGARDPGPNPVPEPSLAALALCGAVVAFARRRRERHERE